MFDSPVNEGEFTSGTELILWRPSLDRRRLEWRAAWASMLPKPLLYLAVGEGIIVAGAREDHVFATLLCLCLGAIGIAAGLIVASINYSCFEHDHQHARNRPCFLERARGAYFFRPNDFSDLGSSTVHTVSRIIAAVRDTHSGLAAAWLSPQHLRDIHHVAWQTLTILDRSRTLRTAVKDARDDDAYDMLVQAGEEGIVAIDHAIDTVLTHLLSTVALVQAWESKLADGERHARLRAELHRLPRTSIASVVQTAESTLDGVFAYITAARDVIDAGPFDWELWARGRTHGEAEARS